MGGRGTGGRERTRVTGGAAASFRAVVALTVCGGTLLAACGGDDSSGGLANPIDREGVTEATAPETTADEGSSGSGNGTLDSGEWRDGPGSAQFYNYLIDSGEEVTVDLYWYREEEVGASIVQHTERFATLAYGEHTEVVPTRFFGEEGVELEEVQYLVVEEGTEVAERAENESATGDAQPVLLTDLYQYNSDGPTAYLNDGGTVVVFLSPATNGIGSARPRVQSFYADLYPHGTVNFPPSDDEIPDAGAGELVLPVGFLFGTESPGGSGPLLELADWRWSANGTCLPEDTSNSYGGDGEEWMFVVPDDAEITVHADTDYEGCTAPPWQEPVSLADYERPFAFLVPTATGEPRMEVIDIP